MTPILLLLAADLVHLATGHTLAATRVEVREGEVVLFRDGGEVRLPRAAVEFVEPVAEAQPTVERAATTPEPVATGLTPRELVRAAAIRHGLPPEFVESVARAESAFNAKAISHKGAIGLMQLMPSTAAALGADPHDPAQNAEAGARLLRELLLRYQDRPDQVRAALAAYNAGEGAVKKYGGVPPYAETLHYVDRVLRHYRSGGR